MKSSSIIILLSTLSLSVLAKRPRAVQNNVAYGPNSIISGNSIGGVPGGVPLGALEPVLPIDQGVLGYQEQLPPGYLIGTNGLPCPSGGHGVLPFDEPYVEPIIPIGGGYGGGGVLPYVEPIIPVGGAYGGGGVLPYDEPIVDVLPYIPQPAYGPEPIVPFNDVLPFNNALPIPNGGYGGGFEPVMDVLPFNKINEPIVPLLKHRCKPRYSEPIVPLNGGGGFNGGGGQMGF
jgi:hypothetical protein